MLIDVTRLTERCLKKRLPTGVDRVSLAYLAHFRSNARAMIRFGWRWLELTDSDSRLVFDVLLGKIEGSHSVIRACVARAYARQSRNSPADIFLNTGHSGLEQPGYLHRVRRGRWKPFFFLHDLIPISHPEYCRPGEATKHHARLSTMLEVGQGLIVNSQATLRDLHDYASERDISLPPCVVASLAPGRLPQPELSRPLTTPYFVSLGTIEPRKNHLLLLHVWREIVAQLGNASPKLFIIGQRGWECEQVVDLLERCEALKDHVIELPRCSDQELANWLAHAQALLFPSFVEGFGMPLVEALASHVPVIASDLPVFREIAGDVPDYLNPLDGLGWTKKVIEYVSFDSEDRKRQCERIGCFVVPTWSAHFSVVDSFLESMVK